MVIALLVLIVLGLVAGAVAALMACSVEHELYRRQAERARLRRTQLETEHRIHLLANRAFSQMLDAARRDRNGE
jgi:cell division protein FtsB